MRTGRAVSGTIVGICVAAFFLGTVCASEAHAQTSDAARGDVEVRELSERGALTLIAENSLYGPVQIGLYLADVDRLVSSNTPLLRVLPARSEFEVLRLDAAAVREAGGLEYEFLYIPGEPGARHAPARRYRLPYAVGSRHVVTQAYPERITHTDHSSTHAVDFAMPVGTGVFAARAGVVMQVAADYFGSARSGAQRANLVRILHDDGTMAVYAHLHWDSIRVVPGQRVERGQRIADSGNTGYSTGPHLHFDVQRNRGGAIVSIPVHFAGLGGEPVTVRSGEEPIAY